MLFAHRYLDGWADSCCDTRRLDRRANNIGHAPKRILHIRRVNLRHRFGAQLDVSNASSYSDDLKPYRFTVICTSQVDSFADGVLACEVAFGARLIDND